MGLGQAASKGELAAATEAVEQVELGRGQGQPPVLVLPEEGDQAPAERLEVGRRGRAPLDERARPPSGADPAGEDDLGRGPAARLLVEVSRYALAEIPQLRLVEQAGRELEHPLDVRLPGTWADDARPGPAAQKQVERVGQHGLAGAGLPRDRRQPGPRPQLGPLDQQEVLGAQLQEHGSGLPARPDGAAPLSHAGDASARRQSARRPNLSRRRW